MSLYITTYSGKQFHLDDPRVDMVDIEDISHALSMICHFAGHTTQFFSVAQHSVLVALAAQEWSKRDERVIHTDFIRWALMHDAAEAYLGDMTRPLKVLLPDYRTYEARVLRVIAEKFDLPWPEPPELKPIDDSILKLEARMLMTNAILRDRNGDVSELTEPPELPAFYTAPMSHIQARLEFRKLFKLLFPDHVNA